MTKQVRFDTLKPGDCFQIRQGDIDMKLAHDIASCDNAIALNGSREFMRWSCGESDLVTPRPDITSAIKKIVGGKDGTR